MAQVKDGEIAARIPGEEGAEAGVAAGVAALQQPGC